MTQKAIPRPQYDALVQLAAELIEQDRPELARKLLLILSGKPKASAPVSPEPEPTPTDPQDETLSPADRKRIRDREFAAKKRLEAKKSSATETTNRLAETTNRLESSPKSSATFSESSPKSSPESSATNDPLARAEVSNSSLETLEISRLSEREEEEKNPEGEFRTRAPETTLVRLVASESSKVVSESSESSTHSRLRVVSKVVSDERRDKPTQESLLWAVWCEVTGAAGKGKGHMERLSEALDTLEPVAMERGVPPAVVFREAAIRFWNDPGIQAGRYGLPLLCSQLVQWMRADAPKQRKGPVPATAPEDFDDSGDDFAHLNEANHG